MPYTELEAELTIDPGQLRLAQDAADGRLGDIRVVLSSRPTDWRFDADMDLFKRLLPVPDEQPRTIAS